MVSSRGPFSPGLTTFLGSGGWSGHSRRRPDWELLGLLPAPLPPGKFDLAKVVLPAHFPGSLSHGSLVRRTMTLRISWASPEEVGSPAGLPCRAVIC